MHLMSLAHHTTVCRVELAALAGAAAAPRGMVRFMSVPDASRVETRADLR